MEIRKDTDITAGGVPTAAQLAAINAQSKAELTAEQVYVFSLRLCDDQPDRDMERFDTAALPGLARLFLGKTGVVDHNWSSGCQFARIFETEVVREDRCSYIKAWAYIRRGEKNDELIADIEAGIKKEVSVGCAMGQAVCSVCGSPYGTCGHEKGQYYDGQLCLSILREPMDAYEFSFVAVPAQPEAGVLKRFGGGTVSLKELAEAHGVQAEYRALWKQAELGQQYEKELQNRVVALCLTLECGLEEPELRSLVRSVPADGLLKLAQALEARRARQMPLHSQLTDSRNRPEVLENGYLI